MTTSWSRCLRKVGYANPEAAQKGIDQYPDQDLHIYLCNWGGHYHIGHNWRPERAKSRGNQQGAQPHVNGQ